MGVVVVKMILGTMVIDARTLSHIVDLSICQHAVFLSVLLAGIYRYYTFSLYNRARGDALFHLLITQPAEENRNGHEI